MRQREWIYACLLCPCCGVCAQPLNSEEGYFSPPIQAQARVLTGLPDDDHLPASVHSRQINEMDEREDICTYRGKWTAMFMMMPPVFSQGLACFLLEPVQSTLLIAGGPECPSLADQAAKGDVIWILVTCAVGKRLRDLHLGGLSRRPAWSMSR